MLDNREISKVFCIFRMAGGEVFKWAKAHKLSNKYDKRERNAERHNSFQLPKCGIQREVGIFGNKAIYWYDRKVLSFEFVWWSPYEWLDTGAMVRNYGKEAAKVLGAEKYIYYIQQPTKSKARGEKVEPYCYFTQFVVKAETPPEEEALIKVWDILSNAAIEGEECGEYRYNRYDRGDAPTARTQKRLAIKRKKEAV